MSPERSLRPAHTLSLLLGITLVALGADLLMQDDVSQVFKEGHSVEAMSVVILLAAAAFRVVGDRGHARSGWHVPVILVLMALRELDFDKRFTSEGVLQLRLYSGPAPLWEKAVGLAVIVLVLVCIVRLAWLNLPGWWRGLQQGAASAWLATGAVLVIVIAKSMDGIDRKLAPLGVTLASETITVAGRLEEMLELAAYIMLAQAAVYLARPQGLSPRRGTAAERAAGA